ncbi:signal transduction histidine kinase/ActR/RegA family two-component response regulator [Hydrogenophaga palleronii]|uniref:histidine kinase n=1 Tax=Hydrogenophaga palleronii TaxID=65655 RepID=A0ABU1WNP7_9BURK|nr:ATP-binding protein [Hydrogenophaga palleronii]MDR7150667.1 signal transduction histidine kinase/ActR/RegA family two-component response regulator [Hydrogenophaga palleronii]
MRVTSLREQLVRAAVLTTLVVVLLNAVALLTYEWLAYRKAWVANIETTAKLMADASVSALQLKDHKSAQKTLGMLHSKPQIQAASLYDLAGVPFASFSRTSVLVEDQGIGKDALFEPTFSGTTLKISYPIERDGELFGTLHLTAQHDIWTKLADFSVILLLSNGLSILVAGFLFGRLQRHVMAPMETMTQVAQDVISSHNWSLRAPPTAYRDVGQLVDAFNSLLSECENRTNDLQQEAESRREIEQQLRQADRQKNEFLATLAHELRNPLAPMTNALALLQIPNAPAGTQDRAVLVLERQLRHMVRLIDDLLDASRISTGQLSLTPQPLDVAALVHVAVEEAEMLAEQKGISLRLHPTTDALQVEGDPIRLAQVFTNLLNNACRYTPTGGKVDVHMVSEHGSVFVFVQDTGVGVDPTMQERIFDLFEQADKSLERGNVGLGVGLSLSRQIVELHKGQLTMTSEGQGRGSCFVVQLPRLQTLREPTVINADARAVHLRRLQILIADDNVDLAESFAELLRASGHQVEVAHDGEAALHMARTRVPDIALLDIGMPKRDGYEVARQLRRSEDTREILLVAISGWGLETDKAIAEQAGFDHYLVKPVEPAELVNILVEAFVEFASSRPGELL